MSAKLRPGVPDDAEVCGQICYDAFGSISAAHGFPSDFPSADVAIGLVGMLLGHPGFYSLVAEVEDVLSNGFTDARAHFRIGAAIRLEGVPGEPACLVELFLARSAECGLQLFAGCSIDAAQLSDRSFDRAVADEHLSVDHA